MTIWWRTNQESKSSSLCYFTQPGELFFGNHSEDSPQREDNLSPFNISQALKVQEGRRLTHAVGSLNLKGNYL